MTDEILEACSGCGDNFHGVKSFTCRCHAILCLTTTKGFGVATTKGFGVATMKGFGVATTERFGVATTKGV